MSDEHMAEMSRQSLSMCRHVTQREKELEAALASLQQERDALDLRRRHLETVNLEIAVARDIVDDRAKVAEAAERANAELIGQVWLFVVMCQQIRNGSPNAFYRHVDEFCNKVRAALRGTREY